MKVYVLYHPQSDHARVVEEYAHDFQRLKDKTIELLSLETREGSATASLYDILAYPAIVVVRDDGQLVKDWQGEQLPLMDEVAAYSNED